MRILLAVCLVWSLTLALLFSDAAQNVFVVGFFYLSGISLLCLLLGMAVFWFRPATDGAALHQRTWNRRASMLNVGVLASTLGACYLDVPFHLRFVLSRPALTTYVRRVPPEPEREKARRIGLFLVRETEVLPRRTVRMITCSAGLLDDAGIVYSPASSPPPIGEDYYLPLGGGWWKWWRSW